jgi:hypothetical protein
MSEEAGPLPETIDELIAYMLHLLGNREHDANRRAAATAKIAALLMRDGLVPSMQGLTQELRQTHDVLKEAAKASEHYARGLVRATWVLAVVTAVLALTAVMPLLSELYLK